MSRFTVSQKRGAQGGNVLVEFALMSTVLLTMTLGVIDYSRVMNLAVAVQGAAEAGAQFSLLSPGHYADANAMRNAALVGASNIPGAEATASMICACSIGGAAMTCPATCGNEGETEEIYAEVEVTVPFQALAGMPGIPPITTIRGRARYPVF